MPRWASLAVLFALSHAVPEVYVNDDSSADGGSFTDCVGLIQEQDWKSAKKACKKAIAEDTAHVESYLKYAYVLSKLSEFSKEKRILEKAIAADPLEARAHAGLGYAHERAENFEAAISAYSEAVRLAPEDSKLRSTLGAVHARAGQSEQAESVFRALCEEYPDDARGHFNFAMALKSRKAYDEALVEVSASREKNARVLAPPPQGRARARAGARGGGHQARRGTRRHRSRFGRPRQPGLGVAAARSRRGSRRRVRDGEADQGRSQGEKESRRTVTSPGRPRGAYLDRALRFA